jgi:hypothetical protein
MAYARMNVIFFSINIEILHHHESTLNFVGSGWVVKLYSDIVH